MKATQQPTPCSRLHGAAAAVDSRLSKAPAGHIRLLTLQARDVALQQRVLPCAAPALLICCSWLQVGTVLMIALVVGRGWLPHLFSGDPAVHSIAQSTLLLIAGAMVGLLPALSLCCSRSPQQHLPQLGSMHVRMAMQHGFGVLPGS